MEEVNVEGGCVDVEGRMWKGEVWKREVCKGECGRGSMEEMSVEGGSSPDRIFFPI